MSRDQIVEIASVENFKFRETKLFPSIDRLWFFFSINLICVCIINPQYMNRCVRAYVLFFRQTHRKNQLKHFAIDLFQSRVIEIRIRFSCYLMYLNLCVCPRARMVLNPIEFEECSVQITMQ